MTDKKISDKINGLIDQAKTMAKIIKEKDPTVPEAPRSFSEASEDIVDEIINGKSGKRGIAMYFPISGKITHALKPRTPDKTLVEEGVLERFDKSQNLILRCLHELSIHPGTKDFKNENISDLQLEFQNLRAKLQDKVFDKYLSDKFDGIVARFDLTISDDNWTSVSVEVCRTQEGTDNNAYIQAICDFNYYF